MTNEHDDVIAMLDHQRTLLRHTVDGLSDEQAGRRTTVSELCLGGVIKHVATTEDSWTTFIVEGASAVGGADESAYAAHAAHAASFRMEPGETLAAILDRYDDVARRTEQLVRSLPSLDVAHPLPEAPWFEPGASWTARHALMHILAETAQHAGHADILREAIDGQKTMG